MDERQRRNLVGLVIGVLLVVGFGLGRVMGDFTGGGVISCDDPVTWSDAGQVVGDAAAVAGPVVATAHEPDVGGAPTFLNLGNPYPDPERFDVVIYEDVRERFDEPPEVALDGEDVCVQGPVREREGVPQLILESPAQISLR